MQQQTFHWNNGRIDRAGNLMIPSGAEPAPAIIVLHSASNPRGSAPLYQHLADILLPLGVAVLRYDRWEAAGRDEPPPSYDDLAADAAAAHQSLRRHPGIDAHRVGFWGISQGGWLASLAAVTAENTAFAILVSTSMCPPREQMEFAVANVLHIRGFGERDVADALSLRAAIDRVAMTGDGKEAAHQALQRARSRPWFAHAYVPSELPTPASSRWAEDIGQQPLEGIKRVLCPVLVLYGGHDPWIPVRISMDALARLHLRNVTALEITEADHVMMVGRGAFDQVDPDQFSKDAPDSRAYFDALAGWLSQVLSKP